MKVCLARGMADYHESLHQQRKKEDANTVDYLSSFVEKLPSAKDDAFLNNAPCPVCGSFGRKLFEKRLGIYSFCDSCQHVYLSKILKSEYLFEWYAGHPPNTLSWYTGNKFIKIFMILEQYDQ